MPSESWNHERRKNGLIDRPLPLQADNSGRQRQCHLVWWQAQRVISSEEGLATPGHPENQRARDLSVMQVQEVRRAVVGFERSQVLRTEMRVRFSRREGSLAVRPGVRPKNTEPERHRLRTGDARAPNAIGHIEIVLQPRPGSFAVPTTLPLSAICRIVGNFVAVVTLGGEPGPLARTNRVPAVERKVSCTLRDRS